MKINEVRALFAILACGFSMVTFAADVKGGKDDPRVGRFDGSEIRIYKHTEFDEFTFLTGPYSADTKSVSKQVVEGKLTQIGYHVPKGSSFAQVARNFRMRLEQQGFAIKFECDTAKGDCGSALDFFASIRKPTELPEPGWYQWDMRNYRFLSAELAQPEGKVFATVYVTKYANAEDPVYVYINILEQQAMAYKMIDAEKMAKEIAETGRVALYGLYFDTNKSEIKPDSRATLEQIAQLLKKQQNLKLVIVGHTDNQGSLDYNMDLSSRRAQAVRQALQQDYGIQSSRLNAWGAGFLAPVASNRSEDGRAKNRRVELVEQ